MSGVPATAIVGASVPFLSSTTPTRAGAGSFVSSAGISISASSPLNLVVKVPNALTLGGVLEVTLAVSDATIPAATIHDTAGASWTPQTGQPANQLQWIGILPSAAAQGDTITVTWSSAVNKGHNATMSVVAFHPTGS